MRYNAWVKLKLIIFLGVVTAWKQIFICTAHIFEKKSFNKYLILWQIPLPILLLSFLKSLASLAVFVIP